MNFLCSLSGERKYVLKGFESGSAGSKMTSNFLARAQERRAWISGCVNGVFFTIVSAQRPEAGPPATIKKCSGASLKPIFFKASHDVTNRLSGSRRRLKSQREYQSTPSSFR